MILAATGHRPDKLGGYSYDAEIKLESIASKWLYDNKSALDITSVIVGMAQGWDLAVAKACINTKIPFTAAIPFVGQETVWPIAKQLYYQFILNQAEKIVIVSKGIYTSKKMQKRNVYMVDHSDQILAMWDQSPGGTANCVKYAKAQNKPIINLYDQYHYPLL